MKVRRTGIIIQPSNSRVLVRGFDFLNKQRTIKIIARVMALADDEVDVLLAQVLAEFSDRHTKLLNFLIDRFEAIREYLFTDEPISDSRKLLIGSYFSQEYALESAALFNPSMIWHPNQNGVPKGSKRFILSLRATGEGHVSSITFRSGIVNEKNDIILDETTPFVTAPEHVVNASYDRDLFMRKLDELGLTNEISEQVMNGLDDEFTMHHLTDALEIVRRIHRNRFVDYERTFRGILTLAQSNYEVSFSSDTTLSERVIFPNSPTEANGIEDARFTEFVDEHGRTQYCATYSAYDGEIVLPQLLQTNDFLNFSISTFNGPEVQNKGMALFPRKINGQYAMISRQDNENVFIMYSDMLNFWYSKQIIAKPTFPWEFVQLGNSGPPIETEKGWLLLTHGVGPMRKYCLGAFLLDLNDPSKIIGRLSSPLLTPEGNERHGYVPNVVYSCGGQIHNGDLIIPYAMSDYASSIAIVSVDELFAAMI
jgi:predicted GH43/DUF377 family glycosyl hydrolase